MSVTINLSQAGATSYEVRNYDGDIVSTGSIAGTVFTIPDPANGWRFGWYRVYLLGPSSTTDFGNSYGATAFIVAPEDDRFPTIPDSVPASDGYGYTPSGWAGVGSDNPPELITRACLGLPAARISIGGTSSTDPAVGSPPGFDYTDGDVAIAEQVAAWWQSNTYGGTVDPVRPRHQWLQFPGVQADFYQVLEQGAPFYFTWVWVFPKDTSIDGSLTFINFDAGTSSGTYKLTVTYNGALVETWDNLATPAAAESTINATSAYIRVYSDPQTPGTPVVPQSGYITKTVYNHVKSVSAACTPAGVEYYEGPYNEWDPRFRYDVLAKMTEFFAAAIREGDPTAKVMGPCPVSIQSGYLSQAWVPFLDAGGHTHLDAISTHAYGTITHGGPGDINAARYDIESWIDLLAEYGADILPRWQTEACHSIISSAGIFIPRRARGTMAWCMLWEQYGTPMEHNPYWYDWSHGFWSYPSFLFTAHNGTFGAPMPQVGLMATLAREIYGKLFHHRIDFGSVPANRMFCGNIYGNPTDGSVAAVFCQSYLDTECSVTFTITGTTGDLTWVDGWGNEDTLTQSSGRVTLPCTDVPSYLRLPAGATATVYSVNDWGASPNPSVSAARQTSLLGTANIPGVCDGEFYTPYQSNSTARPDDATVLFYDGDTATVERVIVWTAGAFLPYPALLDFDIQTTMDGTTWTTQATVTRTADSFIHGTDWTDAGCKFETYWKEQWIEDVKLPAPVTCSGVRVHVRETSYGGNPDAQSQAWATSNGTDSPFLTIKEIGIISSSSFVADDYNTVALADSPVMLLDYEETSGSSLTDLSGNSLACTATGTFSFGSLSTIAGSKALKIGSFIQSGAIGNVTVSSNAALNVGDTFTAETWFKAELPGGFAAQNVTLLSQGDFRNSGFQLVVQGQGQNIVPGLLQLKNGSGVICQGTVTVSSGDWHHALVSKNGSTVKMYLDGQDVTGTVTNHTCAAGSAGLYVGGQFDTNWLTVDKTALYPTALSEARVIAHYRAGSLPSAPTNTRTPRLEGGTTAGEQVCCLSGSWSPPANKVSYQWQSSAHSADTWSDIAGATGQSYLLTASESGDDVRCLVTASTVGGTSSATASDTFTIS